MEARSKSRAVEAAEKARPRAILEPAPGGRWSRAMVGRAVLAFQEVDRIPPFEEDAIRDHVRDFLRFVNRVEAGGVDDEALPLARTFIARGYQWLAQHPRYAPVATRSWSITMVEQLVLWFNDATRGSVDADRALDVAERLHVFERIVRSGAVEPGEAEMLAQAFLDYAFNWLRARPEAFAHFQAL